MMIIRVAVLNFLIQIPRHFRMACIGKPEIMEIFSQLWKNDRTILMVMHDPAIAAFSKSTIRLLDGTVQVNGAAH
jgi:ABC-type Mn2+/Zn2+ transport system ATPase subunit